jgi:adenine phosphoribosyltransferase
MRALGLSCTIFDKDAACRAPGDNAQAGTLVITLGFRRSTRRLPTGPPCKPSASTTTFASTVPDWPAPGVQFRDITPLLQDPKVFRVLIDAFVHRYMDKALRPDVVAGLDARGFILGAVVAYELNVGFIPIRKKGKLPFTTVAETYELEYGSATVELHTDAVRAGDRVLLIDDLIATGGTMMAGKKLLEKLGAEVMEGAAIVDLPELGGSSRLRDSGLPLFTLVDFAGH